MYNLDEFFSKPTAVIDVIRTFVKTSFLDKR